MRSFHHRNIDRNIAGEQTSLVCQILVRAAMDDLSIEDRADGLLLGVRALPGRRRNGIDGIHAGRLKVAVTQVAEKGRANEAIRVVLAESLQLRPHQVQLATGTTSAEKRFLIVGIGREDLLDRIRTALGSQPIREEDRRL